jgi:FkbM family methyltransferase
MFYDFIEIGTSDFATEIQTHPERRGISIEPVKYYLDRLPESPTCKKLNMGISNYTGTGRVNYVPEENIRKYSLPDWIRGCNSINSYHATVSRVCKEQGLAIEEICLTYDVPITTLSEVCKDQGVSGIYYLKIDTEGHDCTILKNFYETMTALTMPHVIFFESNILTRSSEIDEVISLYQGKGYDLISRGEDTLLKLNLTKSAKTQFTDGLSNYYILEYPPGYSVDTLPHENTLSAAQEYCRTNGYSGVTFQDGTYQVRSGKYMNYCSTIPCISWVLC